MEGHCTSERPPFLRRQARAPTCQPCPSLREVACACSALARHCARSLWGRGPARALPTRARAAPSWRHSVHALWKGTARARSRRSFGARPVLPRASPAPHCARWLARVARLRATALALSGDEAQHVRFRRARAPRQAGARQHMEGHCTSGSRRSWRQAVLRASAPHRQAALHEARRPPFLRRQARAPTCQPCPSLREVACACSALARHCARSLWGRGPARALPTRARAAPSWRHSASCTMEGHCTSEKPPFLRRQARAPTCQPCPSLREVACACSALARHCARSLWGRGPARALPTRARAAPSWRHSVHALWKGTARARSRRSFGARPVLPRASPAPHRARWLARVARLRATALALSGDEAQHVRFRRARAPRQAGGTRSMHYGRALHEREAAVPSAPGPCSHVPALPLTARGGLRV